MLVLLAWNIYAKLDALVETLLKDETVDQDGLERILGPRVGEQKA